MKNWRYKIDGDELILTDEEHNQVQEAIGKGANFIKIRNGTIGVQPMFMRKFTQTEQPTDIQIEAQTKTKGLEEWNYRPPSQEEREKRRKEHDKFFMEKFGRKIDWNMNND